MDFDINEMTDTLRKLEGQAAALNKDKVHGKSPFAGALRSRTLSALESAERHQEWLAKREQPEEKPNTSAATN